MAEVIQVNKTNFDRNLAKIGPCHATEEMYTPNKNALYYLTLHPNGFQWDREIMDGPTDTAPLENYPPYGQQAGTMTLIMSESSFFDKISAYVAENKRKAALEAELSNI